MQLVQEELDFTQSLECGLADIPKTAKHQRLYYELKAATRDDFEWLMQLKYYKEEDKIIIRCLDQAFEYDYEFQDPNEAFL